MANRSFYEKVVPDFGDPGQRTTTNPGFVLEVVERDGGVGIGLSTLDRSGFRMCHINADEAEEVVRALQEAIRLVRDKNAHSGNSWPPRVRPT